jgi:hypothetical protein
MILPCKAFLERGESWLLWMLMHRRVRMPSRGMLTRHLSLVGALGTPWIFQRFFIFLCTTRGTKHHGHVEVINIWAVAPNQSSVPLGFLGLLFSR